MRHQLSSPRRTDADIQKKKNKTKTQKQRKLSNIRVTLFAIGVSESEKTLVFERYLCGIMIVADLCASVYFLTLTLQKQYIQRPTHDYLLFSLFFMMSNQKNHIHVSIRDINESLEIGY